MKRYRYHLLLIVVVGVIVYSNTFHVPFQFDDLRNLAENPVIKNLANFLSSSRGYHFNPRRFIGYFSFALNYHFGGLNVTGYHIVNLAIHIISSILVYFMVVLTFRTPVMTQGRTEDDVRTSRLTGYIALFSALLFAVHPVQTQAVTYIVQRFASLAAMFYLLSVVMYIKFRLALSNKVRVAFFAISFLSAVLAMMTKEIAFTLPVIIILYEFTFFKSTLKKKLFLILPILLTMLIIPVSILGTNRPLGEIISDMSEKLRAQSHLSRWDYLMTQMRVIVTYIRLIFFPVNQNLDYDYPVFHSLFALPVFLSFIFLAALFGLGVYLLTRQDRAGQAVFRLTGFGILWFFITISVESSVIPIADVIFEHRLYLPLAGALIAVTTCVFFAAEKLSGANGKAVIISFALIAIAFSGAAYARNMIWKDAVSLWQDVLSKSPRNARAYNNLGYLYLDRGDTDRAISYSRNALRLKPDYMDALTNLGVAYYDKGLYNDAITCFQAALKAAASNADKASSLHNIGLAYTMESRLDDARDEMESALTFDSEDPEIYSDLGVVYAKKGMTEKAVECYRKALNIQPDYAPARYNLGQVNAKRPD